MERWCGGKETSPASFLPCVGGGGGGGFITTAPTAPFNKLLISSDERQGSV